MKPHRKTPLLGTLALLALGACEVDVSDNTTSDKNLKKPVHFATFAGDFRGKADALSAGLGTSCDLELSVTQSETQLQIRNLEYHCKDGTSWGFDNAMTFELRKPTDPTQLAYDLYHNNLYVGFLNYSNNHAYMGVSSVAGATTITLSQDKAGPRLERYLVTTNNWVLFDAKTAKLNKQ